MKTKLSSAPSLTTTYSLLVRSEEKERNAAEAIVYLLITVSALFSIWHAAQQPMTPRIGGLTQPVNVAQAAAPQIARS